MIENDSKKCRELDALLQQDEAALVKTASHSWLLSMFHCLTDDGDQYHILKFSFWYSVESTARYVM